MIDLAERQNDMSKKINKKIRNNHMKKIHRNSKITLPENTKEGLAKKHEAEISHEIELPGNMEFQQIDGWHVSDFYNLTFTKKLDQCHIKQNKEIRFTEIKITYPDNLVVIIEITLFPGPWQRQSSWFLINETAIEAKLIKARLYKDKNYIEAFKFCDHIEKEYIKKALEPYQ